MLCCERICSVSVLVACYLVVVAIVVNVYASYWLGCKCGVEFNRYAYAATLEVGYCAVGSFELEFYFYLVSILSLSLNYELNAACLACLLCNCLYSLLIERNFCCFCLDSYSCCCLLCNLRNCFCWYCYFCSCTCSCFRYWSSCCCYNNLFRLVFNCLFYNLCCNCCVNCCCCCLCSVCCCLSLSLDCCLCFWNCSCCSRASC